MGKKRIFDDLKGWEKAQKYPYFKEGRWFYRIFDQKNETTVEEELTRSEVHGIMRNRGNAIADLSQEQWTDIIKPDQPLLEK